jgi:sulfite reductase beta subunit-like hemoprotein
VRAVAAIFRDHGNRADRRHARLKYLIKEWGIERFRLELESRLTFPLQTAVELSPPSLHDHLGEHPQGPNRWFYGVFVESGRIHGALKSALRAIITELSPGVRLTGQQNLLLTDLDPEGLRRARQILGEHGVTAPEEMSGARRFSQACPALPTCGLALAESERFLPTLLDELEPVLTRLGLDRAAITVRLTGCPNGCARPYTADLAFVGRSLGLYHVYVGGRLAGDRLADLYAADVPSRELVSLITPLLERWARERLSRDEALGDFYQRLRGSGPPRQELSGNERPTIERLWLVGVRQ